MNQHLKNNYSKDHPSWHSAFVQKYLCNPRWFAAQSVTIWCIKWKGKISNAYLLWRFISDLLLRDTTWVSCDKFEGFKCIFFFFFFAEVRRQCGSLLTSVYIQMFALKFHEGNQLIMQYRRDQASSAHMIESSTPQMRSVSAVPRSLASFCEASISARSQKKKTNSVEWFSFNQNIKADAVLLVLHPGSGVLLRPMFTKQPGSVVFPIHSGENRREVVFSCEAQGHPPPFYR